MLPIDWLLTFFYTPPEKNKQNGHGSHVSGTMVARWGGAAGTIAGVNGAAAPLVECKFLNVNGTVSLFFCLG